MSGVPWVGGGNVSRLTDLYEFTMADALLHAGREQIATFELFVRRLPARRNFLVAAGIDDAVALALDFRFGPEDISALRSLGLLSERLLERLSALRFGGGIWAVREGEIVFAGEPLLRVTAPLIEAQLLETVLLNTVLFQTTVVSKAARVTIASAGRPFADFSARRGHGADAALKAARAAYIGGAASTSNVLAANLYAIPASGTMAHSFVLAFEEETQAFRAYAERFGPTAILLIDTYGVRAGAEAAAAVSTEFLARGVKLRGVRLDSGDLAADAGMVREILDDAGQQHMAIFVSGDLDEYEIANLLAANAPIDSFGVGTRLGTSVDAPSLSGVYKLVEDEHGPLAKYSEGKQTLPGAKQVYRRFNGREMAGDVLSLAAEPPAGEPLLRQVAGAGMRLTPPDSLEAARGRCARGIESLPEGLRTLATAEAAYSVQPSEALGALARDLRERGRGFVAHSFEAPKIDR